MNERVLTFTITNTGKDYIVSSPPPVKFKIAGETFATVLMEVYMVLMKRWEQLDPHKTPVEEYDFLTEFLTP